MSEWPEQPRLINALRKLADEAEVDESHKQQLLSRIVRAEPVNRGHSDRLLDLWRTVTRLLGGRNLVMSSLIIATVLIVAVGGWLIADDLRRPVTQVEAGQDDVIGSTSEPPAESSDEAPPLLERAALCRNHGSGEKELEFTVATGGDDGVPIRVRAVDGQLVSVAGAHLVVFGDEPTWQSSRSFDVLTVSPFLVAMDLPRVDDEQLALDTFDNIKDSSCVSALYVAVPMPEMPFGQEFSCRPPNRSQTAAGVVLLDPVDPPIPCSGTIPTLVVGESSAVDVDDWAVAYGCSGVNQASLEGQASVFTFDQCRQNVTVLHLPQSFDALHDDPGVIKVVADQITALR